MGPSGTAGCLNGRFHPPALIIKPEAPGMGGIAAEIILKGDGQRPGERCQPVAVGGIVILGQGAVVDRAQPVAHRVILIAQASVALRRVGGPEPLQHA